MDQDSKMSAVYREVYRDTHYDTNRDNDELRELHEKFDAYLDDDIMADKMETRWFDPKKVPDDDENGLTTEFTDEGEELAYKRYKMTQFAHQMHYKDHIERVDLLQKNVESFKDELDPGLYMDDESGNVTQRDPARILY